MKSMQGLAYGGMLRQFLQDKWERDRKNSAPNTPTTPPNVAYDPKSTLAVRVARVGDRGTINLDTSIPFSGRSHYGTDGNQSILNADLNQFNSNLLEEIIGHPADVAIRANLRRPASLQNDIRALSDIATEVSSWDNAQRSRLGLGYGEGGYAMASPAELSAPFPAASIISTGFNRRPLSYSDLVKEFELAQQPFSRNLYRDAFLDRYRNAMNLAHGIRLGNYNIYPRTHGLTNQQLLDLYRQGLHLVGDNVMFYQAL